MIRCWRLCDARFAPTAFSGEGARLAGGRWNLPGTTVVYASGSQALPALEQLLHVDLDQFPDRFVVIAVDVPEAVAIDHIRAEDLPPDWREPSGAPSCQLLGTKWASALSTAVLSVPSVVVPQETNYVLSPLHRDFRLLTLGSPQPFAFDPRLFARPLRLPRR